MKLAIMQPYFLPYIGYFQLIRSADLFIVYDNIKYTKKGWINRNRMLQNGQDVMFSLPLKKDADSLDVRERSLADDFERTKLLRQLEGAYRRAPHFEATFSLIERIVRYEASNLFGFLHHSIAKTCEHLGITTEIRVSSKVPVDHGLVGQDKVLALCTSVGAGTYINTIGGMTLYAKDAFSARGVELQFIKSRPFQYPQFGDSFVPWLSIVDVLMFNTLDAVREGVDANYDLM